MTCELCGERHPQAHPDIPGLDACEYWWLKRREKEVQPTIHQSPVSSVKIDTDGKGNAKPSVHVYDDNPRIAMLNAVDIYQKLRIQLGLDKIPLIDQEYAEVDEEGPDHYP